MTESQSPTFRVRGCQLSQLWVAQLSEWQFHCLHAQLLHPGSGEATASQQIAPDSMMEILPSFIKETLDFPGSTNSIWGFHCHEATRA